MSDIGSVRIIGSKNREGKGENQFAQPRGVCIHYETKELFIVDCNNHRIQVYHLTSLAYIRQIGKGVQGSAPGCLMYPVGICMDDSGHIYVADTNNHRVVVFNHVTGGFMRTIGSQGSTLGCLNCPYGVCLDLTTGYLYVADYENNRVQVFNKDTGDFIKVLGGGHGIAPGRFNQPIDVSIDYDTDYLYVADYANNRVQVLHKDSGQHIHTIAPASAEDSFNGPRSLCINRESGLLFVSDRENHRIQLYNKSTFQLVRHIGSGMGVGSGQFNRPMELCVDNEEGVLIAVDGYNHRVQIIELPELKEVKERIRSAKLSKNNHILFDVKEVKPSHLAMISNLKCVDAAIRMHTEVPYYLGRLESDGITFDLPIGLSFEDVVVSLMKSTTNQHDTNLEKGNHVDNPTSQEMVESSPISRQGRSFQLIIEQLAKDPHEKSLLPLLSPSLLALQSLLNKGWRPSSFSEEVLNLLLYVLQNIHDSEIQNEESIRVINAVKSLLKMGLATDQSSRDNIRQLLIQTLKVGVDYEYVKILHGKFDPKLLRNETLVIILDLLGASLVQHDRLETGGLGHPLTREKDIINGNDTVIENDTPEQSLDVLNLVFGYKITQTLLQWQDINHLKLSASSLTSTKFQNEAQDSQEPDSDTLFLATPTYLGNLVEQAHALSIVDYGSSTVSGSFITGMRATFLSFCTEVFVHTRTEFELERGIQGGKRKTRGGRNIWLGDRPLVVGDLIDCMDKEKSWFESVVVEALPYAAVKVHFLGWGSKWDDTVTANEIESRIAPLNTFTKNWRAELFEGGLIEIKCNDDLVNQKWMWGKITRLNTEESWVEVAYSFSNEPIVVKKAWLYSETICPVGMHTKDKSKAAAAQIIRPAKTVQDILREKANDSREDFLDDIFMDPNDDHDYDLSTKQSQANSGLQDIGSSFVASGTSFCCVASYVFTSFSRCVVLSISEHIQSLLDRGEKEFLITPTLSAIVKALQELLLFPTGRRLVAICIVRPIYVHAGAYAKLLSTRMGSIAHLGSMSWSSVFQLVEQLERVKLLYKEILGILFHQSLSTPAIEFIKLRLSRTVECCGFNLLGGEMLTHFKSNIYSFAQMLKPLLTPGRYHVEHSALRNLFRGVLSAASPYHAQELLSMIETKLVSSHVQDALQFKAFGTENPVKSAQSLVLAFEEAKELMSNEIVNDMGSKYAVERSFISGICRMTQEEAHRLATTLAYSLSNFFSEHSFSNDFRTSLSYTEADMVQYLIQMCTNEECLSHFKTIYLKLLLLKVLFANYNVSQTERWFLTTLPIGQEITDGLLELDTVPIVSRNFMCHLQSKVDQDTYFDHEILSLAEKDDAVNVVMLNSTRWSKLLNYNTLRQPKLPPVFSTLSLEFEKFYRAQHSNSRKIRFVWCYGQGVVDLAILSGNTEICIIQVNEIECAVLKTLQAGKRFVFQLALSLNAEVNYVLNVLRRLVEYKSADGSQLVIENGDLSFQLNPRIGILNKLLRLDRKNDLLHDSVDDDKTWRTHVIDAGLVRTVKILKRNELIDNISLNSPRILAEAAKSLHSTYSNTLFSYEEIKRRFIHLIDVGFITETIAKDVKSPKKAIKAPKSHRSFMHEFKEAETIEEVINCFKRNVDIDLQSSRDNTDYAVLSPSKPTFKSDMVHWISEFSWTVSSDQSTFSCYGSRIPINTSPLSVRPSNSSFTEFIHNRGQNVWKSAVCSVSALLYELNLLVHQIFCVKRSIDYRCYPIPPSQWPEQFLMKVFAKCDDGFQDSLMLNLFLQCNPVIVKSYFSTFLKHLVDSPATQSIGRTLGQLISSETFKYDEIQPVWKSQFDLNRPLTDMCYCLADEDTVDHRSSSSTPDSNLEVIEDKEVHEGYNQREENLWNINDIAEEKTGDTKCVGSLCDFIYASLNSERPAGRQGTNLDAHSINSFISSTEEENVASPNISFRGTPERRNRSQLLFSNLSHKANSTIANAVSGSNVFMPPPPPFMDFDNDSKDIEAQNLMADSIHDPVRPLTFSLHTNSLPHSFMERIHRSPPPALSRHVYEPPWRAESKVSGDSSSPAISSRTDFFIPPSISNEIDLISRRLQNFTKTSIFQREADMLPTTPSTADKSSPRILESPLSRLLPNYSSFVDAHADFSSNPISGTTSKFIDPRASDESNQIKSSSMGNNFVIGSLMAQVKDIVAKFMSDINPVSLTVELSHEQIGSKADNVADFILNFTLNRMSQALHSDYDESCRLIWWGGRPVSNLAELVSLIDSVLTASDAFGSSTDSSILTETSCALPSLQDFTDRLKVDKIEQTYHKVLIQLEMILDAHWWEISKGLDTVSYDIETYLDQYFSTRSSTKSTRIIAFQPFALTNKSFLCCGKCATPSELDNLFALSCGHYACRSCWQAHISLKLNGECPCKEYTCWNDDCSQHVEAKFVQLVLGSESSSKYLLATYKEHSCRYIALRKASSSRSNTIVSCKIVKGKHLYCTLCNPQAESVSQPKELSASIHKSIRDKTVEKLKCIDDKLVEVTSTPDLLHLVDGKRFWYIYFECNCLLEHINIVGKLETDIIIRINDAIDHVMSEFNLSKQNQSKCCNGMRSIKRQLLSIYADHCILSAPGKYNITSAANDRNAVNSSRFLFNRPAFSSHLLELRSSRSSSYLSKSAQKCQNRSIDDLIDKIAHPLSVEPTAWKEILKDLLEEIELRSSKDKKCFKNPVEVWSYLCNFIEVIEIEEPLLLEYYSNILLKVLPYLADHSQEEKLTTINCHMLRRMLLICRTDCGPLASMLHLILALTSFTSMMNGIESNIAGLDDILFQLAVHVSYDKSIQMLAVKALLSILLRNEPSGYSTQEISLQDAKLVALSNALRNLFQDYTQSEADRHVLLEMDNIMFEAIERMTSPSIASALSEDWKRSLLPKTALYRLLTLLKQAAASNHPTSIELHKVSTMMMRVSKAFGKYAGELNLSSQFADAFRTAGSADISHLLGVCSAIGKLVISFCMRDPSLKEALRDSDLVNALKEKKQQVIHAANHSSRESNDMVSRCNMSVFTLTTAVQSIVLGQQHDDRNLDILTSLGY